MDKFLEILNNEIQNTQRQINEENIPPCLFIEISSKLRVLCDTRDLYLQIINEVKE